MDREDLNKEELTTETVELADVLRQADLDAEDEF